jgi:hypothetical protein
MNNRTQDDEERPRQGWGSGMTNDGEGEKTTMNSSQTGRNCRLTENVCYDAMKVAKGSCSVETSSAHWA